MTTLRTKTQPHTTHARAHYYKHTHARTVTYLCGMESAGVVGHRALRYISSGYWVLCCFGARSHAHGVSRTSGAALCVGRDSASHFISSL